MIWSETSVSSCPNCQRTVVVGIMSLCAACTCGYYYVDTDAHRGWYRSRQAFVDGEQAL